MLVTLNGREMDIPGRPSIDDVLAILNESARGVALAVDGTVVPRSQWPDFKLRAGMRIEVLRAVQGG